MDLFALHFIHLDHCFLDGSVLLLHLVPAHPPGVCVCVCGCVLGGGGDRVSYHRSDTIYFRTLVLAD